jgi:hypothetical protein
MKAKIYYKTDGLKKCSDCCSLTQIVLSVLCPFSAMAYILIPISQSKVETIFM